MSFISPLDNLISISVASLSPSNLGSNSYILLLKSDENDQVVFPIVIGPAEAQTISVFLEDIPLPRPLTSQLIINLLTNFQIELVKVEITDFIDGVFYSKLYLHIKGDSIEMDARPSDAIALAIKMKVPILINKDLINQISIPTEEIDDLDDEVIEEISISDLTLKLNTALEDENYEIAAKLRDQIEKLKIK